MESHIQIIARLKGQGFLSLEDSLELDRRTGRLDDFERCEREQVGIVPRAALEGDAEAARRILAWQPAGVALYMRRLRSIALAGSSR